MNAKISDAKCLRRRRGLSIPCHDFRIVSSFYSNRKCPTAAGMLSFNLRSSISPYRNFQELQKRNKGSALTGEENFKELRYYNKKLIPKEQFL